MGEKFPKRRRETFRKENYRSVKWDTFSGCFNKSVDKVPKTVDKVLKLWINIYAIHSVDE